MGFLSADLQRKVQSRAIVSQLYSCDPPPPHIHTPPAGYITDEGPQPSEWTVLSLIHWQDVQGPFSLFISTAAESQHPDPVISPPLSPTMCWLCLLVHLHASGVESRLAWCTPPILSCARVDLCPVQADCCHQGIEQAHTQHGKWPLFCFCFLLFFFSFYRNYVFVT